LCARDIEDGSIACMSLYHVDKIGLEAFLAELVRLPSVNPPGNEEPVAAVMAAKLRELGFQVTTVEAAPGRPSVIGLLPGSGDGPTLLFNGHMDVQPPGHQWTRDPFAATVEGRRRVSTHN
jgi:acetylornithine deacetylase/succinyl-diaminopimelate desuccinylase-like protein